MVEFAALLLLRGKAFPGFLKVLHMNTIESLNLVSCSEEDVCRFGGGNSCVGPVSCLFVFASHSSHGRDRH